MPFQSLRQRMPKSFSYWIIPLLSGIAWITTLLAMLIYHYTTAGSPRYSSMETQQSIPYISDIGASTLKPLFITGCAITTILLSLTLALERFLRHRGRLAANQTRKEKILAGLSIGFAAVGTIALVGLSIFDTARYRSVHNSLLFLFLVGFVASAVCSCWEYQLLGKHHKSTIPDLRTSFYLKLIFVTFEISLAISFVVCLVTGRSDAAAVQEWILALTFSCYVFSFIPDLLPAMETRGTDGTRTSKV